VARANALATQLADCQNRAPQVITNTQTDYSSVRFVFFKLASSVVTPDQMPNVEMIADYMKNHPSSKVVIKGYASQDGNLDFNIKLAKNRAESVKKLLVKKYGIPESRITAEGEGIGHMFKEESWNRVSICTLDD
ncbi:MAG: OmpA family protein, partial [Pseudoflavonifractor sp.]|nr:OmpA family protein [Pseudoflavonifractor sp.]